MRHDPIDQLRIYFQDFDASLPPVESIAVSRDRAVRERGHSNRGSEMAKILKTNGPIWVAVAAVATIVVFSAVLVLRTGNESPENTVAATSLAPVAGTLGDLSWSRGTLDTATMPLVRSVVAATDEYVAVGTVSDGFATDAAIWRSDDGVTWTIVPDSGVFSGPGAGVDDNVQRASDIVTDGTGYVVVGGVDTVEAEAAAGYAQAGAVWRSDDAAMWELIGDQEAFANPSGFNEVQVQAVAQVGGGGFAAVGWVEYGFGIDTTGVSSGILEGEFDFEAAAWISGDGESWNRVSIDSPEGTVMLDIVDAGGILVAVGNSGTETPVAWTSVDGADWRRVDVICDVCDLAPDSPGLERFTDPFAGGIHAVAGSDRGIVAAGVIDEDGERPVGAIWHSNDGVTWMVGATFDSPERIRDVALTGVVWVGDTLVVAGNERTDGGRAWGVVWMSADAGSTWNEIFRTDEVPIGPKGEIDYRGPGLPVRAITTDGDTVVIVGDAGFTWIGR